MLTGIVRLRPPPLTVTVPEEVPMGRPAGFTVTDKLAGVELPLAVTASHDADDVAVKPTLPVVADRAMLCAGGEASPLV